MKTTSTTKLLTVWATGFLALGIFTPAARAGHDYESLHSDIKSLESITDHLLSDYVAELKRTCSWKPYGREKALYDALYELERCADLIHDAIDCNHGISEILKHLSATRAAADNVNRAASCLHLSQHFRDYMRKTETVLCSLESAVSRYTHQDHHRYRDRRRHQHQPESRPQPQPVPAAREQHNQRPGYYNSGRSVTRAETIGYILSAIFNSHQQRRPYQ